MKSLGLFIITIGIVLTIMTSLKVYTNEKVIDIGAIEITQKKPHSLSWSPIIGIAIIAIGSIFVWKGTKK